MHWIKERKKEIKLLFMSCLIMGIVCLIFYQPMMNLFKDPQQLRHQFQSFGMFGEFIFAMIMALQVVFVFLPGEIVEVMAGFLYGPLGGLFVCMLGSAIGSSLIYVFVKKWGLTFVKKFIKIEKINELKILQNKANFNILLFIIFFIPGTPKDILTYFIPLTDMKLKTYLFITTIARIPSIITSTIGGHAIGIEDYAFSILIFVITGLISIGGILFYKRIVNKNKVIHNL